MAHSDDRARAIVSRRAALGGVVLSAASLASETPAASAPEPEPTDGLCVLTPQTVEGPFYIDPHLLRSDITEGRAGVPLRLTLRVVEAGSCAPIAKARVDVWHADARGVYSGYEGQGDGRDLSTVGQTFLRGTQLADEHGRVAFETIYPGWYPGRATHVHFKVFLDERNVLTGQMFFPDALSEFIYTHVAAYKDRRATREVVNANDGLVQGDDPDRLGFCAIKEDRDRYVSSLVVGVDRNGAGRARRSGPPPGAGPGPALPYGPSGATPRWPPLKDRLKALVPGSD